MRPHKILTVMMMFFLAVAAQASDGWDRNSAYNELYDSHTVQTFSGKILAVDREAKLLPGMGPGVVATLQTAQETLKVHIGPKWFTKHFQSDWNLRPGDQVSVTGSLVDFQGDRVVMASSGRKGDLSLTIRDAQGHPVWDPEVAGF